MDLVSIAVGFLTGSVIGIGTVVVAFFTGPIVSFFRDTAVARIMRGIRSSEAAAWKGERRKSEKGQTGFHHDKWAVIWHFNGFIYKDLNPGTDGYHSTDRYFLFHCHGHCGGHGPDPVCQCEGVKRAGQILYMGGERNAASGAAVRDFFWSAKPWDRAGPVSVGCYRVFRQWGGLRGRDHTGGAGVGAKRAAGGRVLRGHVLPADHEEDHSAPGSADRVSLPVKLFDRHGEGHLPGG